MAGPDPQRILLRADASTGVGTGHVMRCLTLARELIERGWVASLAGQVPDSLADTLRDAGVQAHLLPPGLAVDAEPAWLAAQGLLDVDVVLADSYAIGAAWHRAVAGPGRHIVAIDDLARMPMAVDLLLNQNLGASPARYRGLLPEHAVVLAGPSYAVVRPEFATFRDRAAARTGEIRRVLVFMSGADEHDVTSRAAGAVAASGLEADVVVGSAYPFLDRLRVQIGSTAGVRIHVNTPEMPRLAAAADIAIGAPSSASWERCAVGLPSILVLLADNQVEVGGLLDRLGAGMLLGWHHDITTAEIATALRALRDDPSRVRAMGVVAASITDGSGTRRVADAIAALPGTPSRSLEATV